MKKIDTVDQFEQIISENPTFLLVKHSLTCPISGAAFEQYKQFVEENKEIPTYYLAVQDSRPLSTHIAETYQIKHESPQALLFSNKQVVWDTSHNNITVSTLKEAVQNN